MSLTGAIIAGVGAAGSIGGAAIGANAAGNAANTQANAANYSATLQKQASDAALAENQRQFNIGQKNLAPWLGQGQSALANLSYLMGLPFASSAGGTAAGLAPWAQPGALTGAAQGGGDPNAPGNARMNDIGGGISRAGSPGPDGSPITGDNTAAGPGSFNTGNGTVDLSKLVNPNIGGYGSLMTPFSDKFVAPDNITELNDPGYKARLAQGLQLLQNSAAAKGNLLTGGTAKGLNQFGQEYASNEYGNVYNRALGQYQQNYNIYQQNQANQFNRLSAFSGGGQTAAGQLSSAGQNFANNNASILLGSANSIGQSVQNAAAARASGYVGAGNAYGGALSGTAGNLSNLLLLSKLFGGGGSVPGLGFPADPFTPMPSGIVGG